MVNSNNSNLDFNEILSNIKNYGDLHNIDLNYLTYNYVIFNEWGWDLIPDAITNISKELHVLYHSIGELEHLLKNKECYRTMIYDLMLFDDYETNDKNPRKCPVSPIEYYSKYYKSEFDSIIQ